jgi:hypothetical protein
MKIQFAIAPGRSAFLSSIQSFISRVSKHSFPFKANVHTKNSHGFGVLTSGISLDRYKKNPIVLLNHDIASPIGIAESLQFTGEEASVVVVIDDTDDAFLQKTARDINKNLLKGLSLCIEPDMSSVKTGVEGFPPDLPVITRSILMELSVTPLPANENCLRFTHNGSNFSAKDVLLKLSSHLNTPKTMNRLLLSVIPVLGLKAGSTEDDAIASLAKLSADMEELTSLRKAKADWEKKETELKLSAVNQLVDEAVGKGKILRTQREDFVTLGLGDFETTKRTLDALPARKSMAEQTDEGQPADSADKHEGKTFKQLMRESPETLTRLKANNPGKYKELFNAENWAK